MPGDLERNAFVKVTCDPLPLWPESTVEYDRALAALTSIWAHDESDPSRAGSIEVKPPNYP